MGVAPGMGAASQPCSCTPCLPGEWCTAGRHLPASPRRARRQPQRAAFSIHTACSGIISKIVILINVPHNSTRYAAPSGLGEDWKTQDHLQTSTTYKIHLQESCVHPEEPQKDPAMPRPAPHTGPAGDRTAWGHPQGGFMLDFVIAWCSQQAMPT